MRAATLTRALPIPHFQSGHEQKIENLKRIRRAVHNDGSTLRVVRKELRMLNAIMPSVGNVDGKRTKRLRAVDGAKLLKRHTAILSW